MTTQTVDTATRRLALTISQPYADLIAGGAKWVENRTWRTDFRGWLAIHAGAGQQYLTAAELAGRTTGAIVAVARLVGCWHVAAITKTAEQDNRTGLTRLAPDAPYTWAALAAHQYTEGPWCWVLADVRRLPRPVPCPGQRYLWELPEAVLALVRDELRANRAAK